MKLEHDSILDVAVQNIQDSNYTFKGELNKALQKLIANDIAMTPAHDSIPDIWKCSWYNQFDAKEISSKYGYSKGQAVWLNTEDLTEFIYAKWQEIESVVQKNPKLSYKYKTLKDDKSKLFDFFNDIVLGKQSGALNLEPLYFIGEISDSIQLRVSMHDHNIALPNDDNNWKDFFQYDICADNMAEVSSYISSELSSQYIEHMKDYHLYGADEKQLYNLKKDLEANYVKSDLSSNLSSIDCYKFQSHRSSSYSMNGFDFVKDFKLKKGAGDTVKWYKLWNSGYLEQGGIVSADDGLSDIIEGTEDGRIRLLSVTLPIKYDYVKQRIDKYYAIKKLSSDYSFDDSNCLASDSHYNVSITLIQSTSEVPYSKMNSENSYESCEALGIKNESFMIHMTEGHSKYSFYTSGFIKADSIDNMRQLGF